MNNATKYREYWINVYALPSGRNEMKVHLTKEAAEKAAKKESRRIECIHVIEAETK